MSATHRCAPCGALYLNWVSYCDFCDSRDVKEIASSGLSPAGFVLVPRKGVGSTAAPNKYQRQKHSVTGE